MDRMAAAGGSALGVVSEGATTLATGRAASIRYFDPPDALHPFITTLFHFQSDEAVIEDIQPADVGKLMLVLKGQGRAFFRDGREQDIPAFSLQSPTSVAVPFRFEGGFHSLGAALTPLGWAALSGMPADEHGNQIFDAADFWSEGGAGFRDETCAAYAAGDVDADAMVAQLCAFVAPRLKKVSARHAKLIGQVVEWLGQSLDPDLDELYARSAYSVRQSQRLVERYFGLNPRALKRKYRAVRAAAILSAPEPHDERVAEVEDHFYDQSHLIREIGLFVGRTPSRLGGVDKPILNELLDLRNFRVRKPDEGDFDPGI